MTSWYEKTRTLFGFEDKLSEAESIVSELESELGNDIGEDSQVQLEELKKAADERVKELEAVKEKHGAWATDDHAAPFIVIFPPIPGDRVPLTFQERNARFGDRSTGLEWTKLTLDCERYVEYLENNGFEYECDQFHVNAAKEYATDRTVFDFEQVQEGKLSFQAWWRNKRFGFIKASERVLTPADNAEIFESTLDLYGLYLCDTPDAAFLLHERRGVSAKLRRYKLYGLEKLSLEEAEAQIAATQAPETANGDEVPMTFAEWCGSTLAEADPDVNRNTYIALRADLVGYQHYLFRFPESAPIHEEHINVLHRLQSAYEDDFSTRTSSSRVPGPRVPIARSLSFKDFSKSLQDQEYRRIRSSLSWIVYAYKHYLENFAEEEEVSGFLMSLDWWARGDRRELEGLPRWDPVSAKLKSVMEWISRYIASPERTGVRDNLEKILAPSLLTLNHCMERSQEPTTQQWETIRSVFHDVELIFERFESLMRERTAPVPGHTPSPGGSGSAPGTVIEPSWDFGEDESDSEPDWSGDDDDHYHPVPPIHHRHGHFNPFDDEDDTYQDFDNESQAEVDDFDRLFDEDHQTANALTIPGQDLDDGNSSENGREVEEPLNLIGLREILLDLAEDAEHTDEEE